MYFASHVQTVPNHPNHRTKLLNINDKSLPHKQRRAFTRLLIFKIKFSSEPPSRWLAWKCRDDPRHRERTEGSRRGHANHRGRWIKSRPHGLIIDCGPPAARELSVNPKKSWSLNLRLNLKIANFLVLLYGANQRPNRRWSSFRPNL